MSDPFTGECRGCGEVATSTCPQCGRSLCEECKAQCGICPPCEDDNEHDAMAEEDEEEDEFD